jgi:hypothetical protein
MAIFHSASRIQFGAPVSAPNDLRPTEALFVQGKVPPGHPFALTWTYSRGVVGYHVFRSQSVRHIRDRSMHHLWQGHYRESITHFVIGDPDIDTIIDDYKLRGAQFMFYWVLAQDEHGNLGVIKDFQVRMADDFARSRRHFALDYEPQIIHEMPRTQPVPTANLSSSDPRARPLSAPTAPLNQPRTVGSPTVPLTPAAPRGNVQPAVGPPANIHVAPARTAPARSLRQVYFVSYTAPTTFEIQSDGVAADHYQIYVGPSIPAEAELADAMWDGNLLPGNPMRCYTLPGAVKGFVDKFSPPGQQTYLAIFALRQDGSRSQPNVVIPPTPPAPMAELT